MNSIKIVETKVLNNSTIQIRFSNYIDEILIHNFSLKDYQNNDIEILSLTSFNSDTIELNVKPLIYNESYTLSAFSITESVVYSTDRTAVLGTNDINNIISIFGILDNDNVVKDYVVNYLKENIYDLEDPLYGSYVDSLSYDISRLLYAIRQVKNEQYLSIDIQDELKTRGDGAFDHLVQEGCYLVHRVSPNPTGTTSSVSVSTYFDYFPISLQQKLETSENINVIDVDSLIFTTKYSNVIKVLSLSINNISYDIFKYGYYLTSNNYDKYSKSFSQLKSNEIKINSSFLLDNQIYPQDISAISVSYLYKDAGYIVNSIPVVYTIDESIREVCPSIMNIFALKHTNIVNSDGTTSNTGMVSFIDPLTMGVHQAFINELQYNPNNLPSHFGDYAIDYSTSNVYVYGTSSERGSGTYPPIATYHYKQIYTNDIDYSYDSQLMDIVSIKNGNLIGKNGFITFDIDYVWVDGVDYVNNIHKESLEYINNNLVAINSIKTLNSPITNVFKIYNETTGEIYSISRWNNDRVYFNYINPPNILDTSELISFQDVNHIIEVTDRITVSCLILKFPLQSRISGLTSDCIGSSINTSVIFSSSLFMKEIWYDAELATNLDRITPGLYTIDYVNGIGYLGVSADTDRLGSVSYKTCNIQTQNKHIITVDNINYVSGSNTLSVDYTSFSDQNINLNLQILSSELYFDPAVLTSYYINNSGYVGYLDVLQSINVNNVQYNGSYVRGIFEHKDLQENLNPIRFSGTINNNVITINPIETSELVIVKQDIGGYYVEINQTFTQLSSFITFTATITKLSNSEDWTSGYTVVESNGTSLVQIRLDGVHTPTINDQVIVEYTITINNDARLVVDYSKGDFEVNYSYLADEIYIQYEYGENELDFSKSNVEVGTDYYVSYKAGALRDALLKNFASLTTIPELNNFDLSLDRERYRDIMYSVLSSFSLGPTLTALKNITKNISHIEPTIKEGLFNLWSLGTSLLNPSELIGKNITQLNNGIEFNSGAIIGDGLSIVNLNQGTFEASFINYWDALDSMDSDISFTILVNGGSDLSKIHIGSSALNPSSNTFLVNKNTISPGFPKLSGDGVYIYYDSIAEVNQYNADINLNGYRWFICIVNTSTTIYKINMSFDGELYGLMFGDSSSIFLPESSPTHQWNRYNHPTLVPSRPAYISTTTKKNSFSLTYNHSASIDIASFIVDRRHYLFDFGEESKNRMSLYKDVNGSFIYEILDRNGKPNRISYNIPWKKNEEHVVATSWKLNTDNDQDEMHLFVDGYEVPNIGFNNLYDKYNSVNYEVQEALNTLTISGSNMRTVMGSNVVTLSNPINGLNVLQNNRIYIQEPGFDPAGYYVSGVSINGLTLTLSANMAHTLNDVKYNVNPITLYPTLDVNIFKIIVKSHTYIGNATVSYLGFNKIDAGIAVAVNSIIKYNNDYYNVTAVDGTVIYLDNNVKTSTSSNMLIYSPGIELNGLKSNHPYYQITGNDTLVINTTENGLNGLYRTGLISIYNCGLNNQVTKTNAYLWSAVSPIPYAGNILKTNALPPLSMEDVKIYRNIIPNTLVSLNSFSVTNHVLFSGIKYTSEQTIGRHLTVSMDNAANTTGAFTINVTGLTASGVQTEVLNLYYHNVPDPILSATTVNQFITVTSVTTTVAIANISKSAFTYEINEANNMFYKEDNSLPDLTLQYTYKIDSIPENLTSSGNTLYTNYFLSNKLIGSIIELRDIATSYYFNVVNVINNNPIGGTEYTNEIIVDASVTGIPFTSVHFYNKSNYGYANGFFLLRSSDDVLGIDSSILLDGMYKIKYLSYLNIDMDLRSFKMSIGNSLNLKHPLNGNIKQVKICDVQLSDVRVGETSSKPNITSDYNSSIGFDNSNTLLFLDLKKGLTNLATLKSKNINLKQSLLSVNDSFNNSIYFDRGYQVENEGYIDGRYEGSVEFWVNPLYDVIKDPNQRYFFDASNYVQEDLVSSSYQTIPLNNPTNQIISVTIPGSDINYYDGGRLEFDSSGNVSESLITTPSAINGIQIDLSIVGIYPTQVLAIYNQNDLLKTNVFEDGLFDSKTNIVYLTQGLQSTTGNIIRYRTDNVNTNKVIILKKQLPKSKTNVKVTYIPKGSLGNRISIYKDQYSNLIFSIIYNFGLKLKEVTITSPIDWKKDSWHRILVSFQNNKSINTMRMFIDGFEYGKINVPSDMFIDHTGLIDKYSNTPLSFADTINNFYIGSKFDKSKSCYCLINNFKISNRMVPIYAPYNEPIDGKYSTNLEAVIPSVEDATTTYMLDGNNTVSELNTAVLQSSTYGVNDFELIVNDGFGYISSSAQVKYTFEKLISILKPASSRVKITYE